MKHKDSNDAVFDQLLSLIEEHGWAVRHVGAGHDAAFSYTVGLTALEHPEIVMEGLPFEVAQAFLNFMGEEVKAGRRFTPGSIATDLTDSPAPIAFISVENVTGLTAVAEVYGEVNALQAIWSDSTGRLPWEPSYRNPADAQPLLGPVPDSFK
ncbi:DUF4262 domain-containing protein [Paenarthrobacter nicotinovorans]|uniref:DUF4262 domain-containing protein n=1 Tax=Paenarthrobacter nicotinovorans TaxID=29320 RepID=UPI00047AFC0E|nr:DUF4262 domain-containing protein [Paenarthrobacter nicotinovorans]